MKTLVRVFLLLTFSFLAFKAEKLEDNTAMNGLEFLKLIAKRSIDRSIEHEVSLLPVQIKQKRSLLGNVNIFLSDVLEDTGTFFKSIVPDVDETTTLTTVVKGKKHE